MCLFVYLVVKMHKNVDSLQILIDFFMFFISSANNFYLIPLTDDHYVYLQLLALFVY